MSNPTINVKKSLPCISCKEIHEVIEMEIISSGFIDGLSNSGKRRGGIFRKYKGLCPSSGETLVLIVRDWSDTDKDEIIWRIEKGGAGE